MTLIADGRRTMDREDLGGGRVRCRCPFCFDEIETKSCTLRGTGKLCACGALLRSSYAIEAETYERERGGTS